MLDQNIRDLATSGKNFAALSFHLDGQDASGQIATHIMWVDADAEHILINTEVHRLKYRSITANPSVTVTVWDAQNPYRYAEVRGTLAGEVRGDEARAHIDAVANRYTGGDYAAQVESERVILKIAPVRQRYKG